MSKYSLVGVAETPREISDILDARRKELGLSFQSLDHVSGLQQGYCSKVLSPGKYKQMGDLSMSCLLGALGLKLAIIADDDSLPKITRREIEHKTTFSASMSDQRSGSRARKAYA